MGFEEPTEGENELTEAALGAVLKDISKKLLKEDTKSLAQYAREIRAALKEHDELQIETEDGREGGEI
jgi:hypothetical protein